MYLRSGAPLLTRYLKGKGEVYLFSVSFSGNMSNFARHAVFVPVMYRIALLVKNQAKWLILLVPTNRLNLQSASVSGDEVFHLINDELKFDIIPGHRTTGRGHCNFHQQPNVNQAANYDLNLREQPYFCSIFKL